jgi:fucose permease
MNATSTDSIGIHRTRLFAGICLALIPTGASFALIASIIPQLKVEFILTNLQVGAIAGAAIWGMAISLLVIGPMLEGLGMKKATWAAFLGHLLGVTLMISGVFFRENPTVGFWVLMAGAALFAAGNGMIEVAGNPLTAALYPRKKAHMLNIFHAFFPLAIVAGALIATFLSRFSPEVFLGHWTFYIGLIYIPIILYGVLVLRQNFPQTENAEAGVSVKEMFRFTFSSPLMYGFLAIMAIAIGLELGIGRWIPAIYNAVELPGLLMLAWVSGIMMVLRFLSGPILERVSPPALLAGAAFFTGIGIYLFGIAQSTAMGFISATFFGMGVAFFFPTIVGLVAERLPKSGSLGIVLTCGIGLLSAGTLGNMGVGALGDRQLASYLNEERRGTTIALLDVISETFPAYAELAAAAANPVEELGFTVADVTRPMVLAQEARASIAEAGEIAGTAAPQALRAAGGAVLGLGGRIYTIEGHLAEGLSEGQLTVLRDQFKARVSAASIGDATTVAAFAGQSIAHAAYLSNTIMGPAEGYAGQRAIKQLAWVPFIMVVFFGFMFMSDRRKGGYKAVHLEKVNNPKEKVSR